MISLFSKVSLPNSINPKNSRKKQQNLIKPESFMMNKLNQYIIQQMIDNPSKMKNIYSWYEPREWIETIRNDKKIYISACTGEQFTIERVPIYSDHIFEIYRTRAVYPLPNTPKIMLPNRQTDMKYIDIWIQRAPYNLQKLFRNCSAEVLVLNLFKQLLSIIDIIVKKYGFFRVKERMIKVSKGGFLQVWVNQFEECCHRQYPLSSKNAQEDYRIMISDLIQIFILHKQEKAISKIIHRAENESFISFEKLKVIIESIVRSMKTDFRKKKPSSAKGPNEELPKFLKNKINNSVRTLKYQQTSFSPKSKKTNKIISQNNRSYTFIPGHKYKKSSIKCFDRVNQKSRKELNPQKEFRKKSSEIKRKVYYDESGNQHEEYEIQINNPQNQQAEVKMSIKEKNVLQPEKFLEDDNKFLEKESKKEFRDSGTTFATNQYHSIYSSGNMRLIDQISQQNSSNKELQSSFGKKSKGEGKKTPENTQKSKFKVSKIIEQKPQDSPNTPQSISKSEHEILGSVRESQIERDLNFLLKSDHFNENGLEAIEEDRSFCASMLEDEMNNLLDI